MTATPLAVGLPGDRRPTPEELLEAAGHTSVVV
jgi:hypothetical protein